MTDPHAGPSLLVCTALRIEAVAVRRALPAIPVVVVGMRARRLSRLLEHPALHAGSAVALVGVGGGLHADARPGDVLVASQVRTGERTLDLAAADVLLDALHRRGLSAVAGPIAVRDHLVRGGERAALASDGCLAVDMESGMFVEALTGRGVTLGVLRVVVDTPRHELIRPGVVVSGMRALRTLRRVVEVLPTWAATAPSAAVTALS